MQHLAASDDTNSLIEAKAAMEELVRDKEKLRTKSKKRKAELEAAISDNELKVQSPL